MLSLVGFSSQPATAQGAVDEVRCLFFDDWVDSGWSRDGALRLSIASSGDDLPSNVRSSFDVIEASAFAPTEEIATIDGYFAPLCGSEARVAVVAATSPDATPSTPAAPAASTDGPAVAEELPRTGPTPWSPAIAATGGLLTVLGGAMLGLRHARFEQANGQEFWADVDAVPSVDTHHRFWLLDDDAS